MEEMVHVLTATQPHPRLSIRGRIQWVQPPRFSGGFLALLFKHPRAVTWLMRAGGLSRGEAAAVIARLDTVVDGRIGSSRIGTIPAEAKALLGLEAAWAKGADAIVLQTVGLGGLPESLIFQAIAARLPGCSAIHLCHERWSAGHLGRACFPGGRCLELVHSATAKQAS